MSSLAHWWYACLALQSPGLYTHTHTKREEEGERELMRVRENVMKINTNNLSLLWDYKFVIIPSNPTPF